MPRFTVKHITHYNYFVPVRDNANLLMLYPIKDANQAVLKHNLKITNEPQVMVYKDYYGNDVGVFTQASSQLQLTIESELVVITNSLPLPHDRLPAEDQWKLLSAYNKKIKFIDFLLPDFFLSHNEIKAIASSEKEKKGTPLETALHLNEFVFDHFEYVKGITNVETTIDEIWKIKAGVCQDFAHILLSMLRLIDIPARYVSGYICPNQSGMRGEGATHAWVEAFIPGFNWIGLDPTNNCIVTDKHIRLAVGRSFLDCSPVKGSFKGSSQHSLEVGVSISHDNEISDEISLNTVLQPQRQLKSSDTSNSYRKYMELIEIQQQQQQQQ